MNPVCIQQKSIQPETFECDYCGNIFKHHQNMYRHMKYRCKEKNISNRKIKILAEQNKQLLNTIEN